MSFSFADYLCDFNVYIVCTTSEYNTVNNIQPVFNKQYFSTNMYMYQIVPNSP